MSILVHPARWLGYAAGEAGEVGKGLAVFGLLMAGWVLMAVLVSPAHHDARSVTQAGTSAGSKSATAVVQSRHQAQSRR